MEKVFRGAFHVPGPEVPQDSLRHLAADTPAFQGAAEVLPALLFQMVSVQEDCIGAVWGQPFQAPADVPCPVREEYQVLPLHQAV